MKNICIFSIVLLTLSACAPASDESSLASSCMGDCAAFYLEQFGEYNDKDAYHCEFDHCAVGGN